MVPNLEPYYAKPNVFWHFTIPKAPENLILTYVHPNYLHGTWVIPITKYVYANTLNTYTITITKNDGSNNIINGTTIDNFFNENLIINGGDVITFSVYTTRIFDSLTSYYTEQYVHPELIGIDNISIKLGVIKDYVDNTQEFGINPDPNTSEYSLDTHIFNLGVNLNDLNQAFNYDTFGYQYFIERDESSGFNMFYVKFKKNNNTYYISYVNDVYIFSNINQAQSWELLKTTKTYDRYNNNLNTTEVVTVNLYGFKIGSRYLTAYAPERLYVSSVTTQESIPFVIFSSTHLF